MIKHTPGPWELSRMRLTQKDKDRRCGFVVNAAESDPPSQDLPVRICDLRVPQGINGFSEGEANARLIAAAPDLLEALQNCQAYFKTLDEMQPDRTHGRIGDAVRSSVDAAIAKATSQPVSA